MFTESLGYGRPRAQHARAEKTADLLKLSGQRPSARPERAASLRIFSQPFEPVHGRLGPVKSIHHESSGGNVCMKEPEIRVPIATATDKGMETLSVNGFRVSSSRLSQLGTKGQLPEQNKTKHDS